MVCYLAILQAFMKDRHYQLSPISFIEGIYNLDNILRTLVARVL